MFTYYEMPRIVIKNRLKPIVSIFLFQNFYSSIKNEPLEWAV